MARTSQFPANCGLKIISQLGVDTPVQQYEKIKKALLFKDPYDSKMWAPQSAAVLISDTLGCSNWKHTKKLATKVELGKNPNSGNTLAIWIIDHTTLSKLEKELPKTYLEELEKEKEKHRKRFSSNP